MRIKDFSWFDKIMYYIKKSIITTIGSFQWFGFKHPFFLLYYPPDHELNGLDRQEFQEKILKHLEPGDILLLTKKRFVSSNDYLGIPGEFKHAGLFVGYKNIDKESDMLSPVVIEARTREGVTLTHLYDFLTADMIMIVRPNIESRYRYMAAERALTQLNKGYDFNFKYNNTVRFFCTELVGWSYDIPEITYRFNFNLRTITKFFIFKQTVLLADDIARSNVKLIWANRSARSTKLYNDVFLQVPGKIYPIL